VTESCAADALASLQTSPAAVSRGFFMLRAAQSFARIRSHDTLVHAAQSFARIRSHDTLRGKAPEFGRLGAALRRPWNDRDTLCVMTDASTVRWNRSA